MRDDGWLTQGTSAEIMTRRDARLWRAAYQIGWVGACNARAVENTLREFEDYGDHPAVRVIAGHLAFLRRESLGPADGDLDRVVAVARRKGWSL